MQPGDAVVGRRSIRSVGFHGLEAWFGLDPRSLAVVRIGLALLLLVDLATRAPDLRAHYTDDGVLPRLLLSSTGPTSVHVWSGTFWFQVVLFALAAGAAVALLLGYRTLLATGVSWFLLLSLQARNPLINNGGDLLLRLLLFWGLFLPLGACWSLDARRSGRTARGTGPILSVGSAALVLQVCFVYWFTVILKSDPSWRSEGTAIYYALSLDMYATPIGKKLLDHPDLIRWLTFATFWLEAIGPALLFIPFYRGAIRVGVVTTFVGFHLVGLGVCMRLGLFPWVCAVAWLAFLPAGWWDGLARCWGRTQNTAAGREGAEPIRLPLPAHLVAGYFLVYLFFWNLRSIDPDRYSRYFPIQMNTLGRTLGLGQEWSMFAPRPMRDNGCFIAVGTLADGRQVDLLRDRPATWVEDGNTEGPFGGKRWGKYLLNLRRKQYARHRPYLTRHLAQHWERTHPDEQGCQRVDLYYIVQRTLPDYRTAEPRAEHLHRETLLPSAQTVQRGRNQVAGKL